MRLRCWCRSPPRVPTSKAEARPSGRYVMPGRAARSTWKRAHAAASSAHRRWCCARPPELRCSGEVCMHAWHARYVNRPCTHRHVAACALRLRAACAPCMNTVRVHYARALHVPRQRIPACMLPVPVYHPSGSVTHAGLPVKSGQRCVFVASFSPKTSADGQVHLRGYHPSPAAHCVPSAVEVSSVGASASVCSGASPTATASHRRMAAILQGR